MIIFNPYARGLCRAVETNIYGPEHVHHCTGPSGHGGGEHICECETWWRPIGTPLYADRPTPNAEEGVA